MKDIKDLRKEINEIDKEMADLFEKRMDLAKEVALYKKERSLAIYDEARENEIINKNKEFIKDDEIKEYYVNFIKDTMNISKSYQEKIVNGIKVAYSGVAGAFAYVACKKLFPGAEYISCSSFASAYKKVEDGICDTCILPLENSFAGDVGDVMDLVFNGNLYINRMYELEITHNLIAKKGVKLENIKTVISHPQALEQCKDYIEAHHLKTIVCANTALAAKQVKESNDDTLAAIASLDTASLYDLDILEESINTSKTNTTRFGVFSRVLAKNNQLNKMGEHFILVFTVKNEAGALAKTLNIIGAHGFNMRNLRSRPMKGLMWNYYFFLELEGNINTSDGEDMIKELQGVCDKLKLVGTYHKN